MLFGECCCHISMHAKTVFSLDLQTHLMGFDRHVTEPDDKMFRTFSCLDAGEQRQKRVRRRRRNVEIDGVYTETPLFDVSLSLSLSLNVI